MPGDSSDDPIVDGATPRGFKWCRCSKCELVAMCTPAFDFWTLAGDELGPLLCEGCLDEHLPPVPIRDERDRKVPDA